MKSTKWGLVCLWFLLASECRSMQRSLSEALLDGGGVESSAAAGAAALYEPLLGRRRRPSVQRTAVPIPVQVEAPESRRPVEDVDGSFQLLMECYDRLITLKSEILPDDLQAILRELRIRRFADGRTMLHVIAAARCRPLVASYLIETLQQLMHDGDEQDGVAYINAQDDHGRTTLHYAAHFYGDITHPLVMKLIELGACPNSVDTEGHLPACYVQQRLPKHAYCVPQRQQCIVAQWARNRLQSVKDFLDGLLDE